MKRYLSSKKFLLGAVLAAASACFTPLFHKKAPLAEIRMFPDNHTEVADDRELLAKLPLLHREGYRALALECPSDYQEFVDAFLAGDASSFDSLVMSLSLVQTNAHSISTLIKKAKETGMAAFCVDELPLFPKEVKENPSLFVLRDAKMAESLAALARRYGKVVAFLGIIHTLDTSVVEVGFPEPITTVPAAHLLGSKHGVLVTRSGE